MQFKNIWFSKGVYFSKEETICAIDPDPWVSPELLMSNSDDKTDPFTQPHWQDKNLLTQNERNPAEADTAYRSLKCVIYIT